MLEIRFKDTGTVKRLLAIAGSMSSFPESRNPLLTWRREYGLRTATAQRPTVGQDGMFRGEHWPALEPQYTRKTDGVVVPVWGGVPRAVLGGGRYQQLGYVSRAGEASIRQAKFLTPAQKRAGFGRVREGQVISASTVQGKLRKDGSRYKQSDKQMARQVNASDNILGDWIAGDPEIRDSGKSIKLTSRFDWAGTAHKRRPFAFGPAITPVELRHLRLAVLRYVRDLLGRSNG